jgi:hypothetical protein
VVDVQQLGVGETPGRLRQLLLPHVNTEPSSAFGLVWSRASDSSRRVAKPLAALLEVYTHAYVIWAEQTCYLVLSQKKCYLATWVKATSAGNE